MAPVKSLCESRSSSFGIFLPFFFLLSVCGDSPPTAGLALESIWKTNSKDGSTRKSFFKPRVSNSPVNYKPNPHQQTLVSLFRYFLKTHFIKRAIASEGDPNSSLQLLIHKRGTIHAASPISLFPGSLSSPQADLVSGNGEAGGRRAARLFFFFASLAGPRGNPGGIKGSPSAHTLRFHATLWCELYARGRPIRSPPPPLIL